MSSSLTPLLEGGRLFGRVARVVIGSLLIEGLRLQFKIKKTSSKEPNECHLAIYNLSQQSRASLQSTGERLIVEAGYGSTIAQIFSGSARSVDHAHDGPDWITKAQCGDGEIAYRYATVSESFRPGTLVGDVFARIAQATGLDVADAVSTFRARVPEQFTAGYSATGKAAVQIDRLVQGRGLEWSIQDGRLQLLPIGETVRDSVILLNADSGLIGSPEHGTASAGTGLTGPGTIPGHPPQVLKVKSLLQPSIAPGRKVRVEALSIQGDFRVLTATHSGDTHGGEWYTEIEAVPG